MEGHKRGLTGRGLGWEMLNSLWMLLSLVPILNAGAFLYIGFSARQRKWVFWGCAFLLFGFFWSPLEFMYRIDAEIWIALAFLTWMLGVVLCIAFRKEYLLRRDLLLKTGGNKARERALKERLTREYAAQALRDARPAPAAPAPAPQAAPPAAPPAGAKVDVNACTEEELTALPGITAVQAKKAADYRARNGGFADLDAFLQYLGVKPHFAVQIRELAVCTAPARQAPERGRMLDL